VEIFGEIKNISHMIVCSIVSRPMKNQVAAKISLKAYIIGDSLPILIVLGLAFIVHPAVGLLLLIFPLRYWMIFSSVSLTLDDAAAQIKLGLLSRTVSTISLRKIESTGLRQSISGRIFGFGQVEFKGTGGTSDFSPMIENPESFKLEIERRMEVANNPPTQPKEQAKPLAEKPEPPIKRGERFDFATQKWISETTK
jgi:uncharacterized membrane protein YdbT with pleckstrin-like domain